MSIINMSRIKSNIEHSPHIIRRRSKTTLREAPQFLKPKQKPTLEHLQTQIFQNHQTINNIIDQFQNILYQKLEKHEDQILKVYRNSMQKLVRQVQIMMKQYNKLMELNRTSTQMNILENQLQYFTKESIVLFQQNKKYQSEIKNLKKTIQQLKNENQTKNLTILNLTRKLYRKTKKIEMITYEKSNSVVSATHRKPSQSYKNNISFLNQKNQSFKLDKVSKTFYKTEISCNDDIKIKL